MTKARRRILFVGPRCALRLVHQRPTSSLSSPGQGLELEQGWWLDGGWPVRIRMRILALEVDYGGYGAPEKQKSSP